MQNIINFENIVNDKKISVNLINELIGYAENEANIPAIRKAVASVRSGRTFVAPDKKGDRDPGKWYKTYYAKMKQRNDESLSKAFLALRNVGMTNSEIAAKTGSYRVSALIGATPKAITEARRERVNAERREKMQELRKQGMNKKQIAKAMGVSTALVNSVLGKYTDEERKAILLQNLEACHKARKLLTNYRGNGHWMRIAKEERVRTLGPIIGKMRAAGIPYRQITATLGYSEMTIRAYHKQYLSSFRHDS